MHSDLHGNVVHHEVELLLLVSMLSLLTIPKSLLILKKTYTLVCTVFCVSKGLWLHQLQTDTSAD